ncbi:MAG: threonine transporter RhtB [Alistipes sp.]|nr:threonine transporter RhtB [Alistipes sp.]
MIVELLEILFGGLCVGLASSVTVGPVAVLCIQRTLSKGHLSGLVSGLGIACADTIMAILAFTVYSLLKRYIDEYSTAIQLCGGIFVVIVGIFIFFKNPVPQIRKNRAGHSALWQDFASMFGFTLANFVVVIPYILAFFTMFNIDLAVEDTRDEAAVEVVATEEAEEDVEVAYVHTAHGAIAVYETSTPAEETQVEESAEVTSEQPAVSRMLRNTLVLGGFLLGAVLWWAGLTSLINFFRRGFRPRHMLTINHIAGVIISILGIYTLVSVLIS